MPQDQKFPVYLTEKELDTLALLMEKEYHSSLDKALNILADRFRHASTMGREMLKARKKHQESCKHCGSCASTEK